ncbi:MAP7 domain containing protein ensconsin isoform X2 [Haematobia irritans]|uniref:MAP7 domain containing protein ensconsin isoform X2 n=1 Tax=Haematobia irritans TaxID=7368 RepID=UPI003F5074FF
MASLGGEHEISINDIPAESTKRTESREGSVERKAKERDDKLKVARERQNEERQRKIEELKAQAEAAQRYREQKEEERRRRIDEIRQRDSEKRTQVEERKKAIMEAEKERREYILRKNMERESRIEVKKRERNSIGYAFGSSTPRLLEPADFGMVSSSTFLGQRRSTSISNVAGASLSRRSSERELNDCGSKKRATSASGTDRHEDHRRSRSSMYEVFNWGYINDEPPKRFSLSIVGSEINIDGPPIPATTTINSTSKIISNTKNTTNNTENNHHNNHHYRQTPNHNNFCSSAKEDHVDSSHIVFRSVARRKTDLMPTIPSPRDGHYGSRSSLSNTPSRTPGRAYSMNRLDQLAQPIRRNGEHIRAILERQRREHMEMMDETESLGGGRRSSGRKSGSAGSTSKMSRSMIHLAGEGAPRPKYNLGGGISTSFLPLGSGSRNACKSMTHLGHYCCNDNNDTVWSSSSYYTTPRSNLGLQTAATKKYLQSSLASSASNTSKRGQISNTNLYRFDTDSLLLMNSPSLLLNPGSRSGTVTPGGHTTSRPGSAMSTSTTMSTSGFINRRSMPAARKPRPASIAGTVVSVDEINKLKKENKPPVKNSSISPSAQTTPKRSTNMMSTSLIVTSSSSRLFSAEKKTPVKREPLTPKATTPKPLSKTASSDRLHKLSKEKSKELMSKSGITPPSNKQISSNGKDQQSTKSKEQKEAINQVKTEESAIKSDTPSTAQQNGGGHIELKKPISNDNAKESPLVEIIPHEEKADEGTEKDPDTELDSTPGATVSQKPKSRSGSKEGSMVRDLPPAVGDNPDAMTASMMAKSKITTEEEAKAALAERRRLAREEAERQAELERQRLEAERLAELKRQEEEAERQRQFEEEAMRLAEEQRKAEEERLRQAIEEAKQREEEERQKREEEEKQRIEREEAEKKAKEEAEKQKIEVAERLKREEKEREERRKRVEAIMSRTRRVGPATNTPNSTPTKENNNSPKPSGAEDSPNVTSVVGGNQETTSNSNVANTTLVEPTQTSSENSEVVHSSIENSGPTSGSSTTSISPSTPAAVSSQSAIQSQQYPPIIAATAPEHQNTQAMYEQSVIDKENSLINSFSNMIIDENAKNMQQNLQQQQQIQAQIVVEETNGKQIFAELQNNDSNTTSQSVANGNGHHIESISNKNDIDILQTVVPSTNQLIDLSLEPQDTVNFNNNNSLITTTTTTLVTADSHENKDISLL